MRIIGQDSLVKELRMVANDIRRGNKHNILLSGSSGHGKTTLARYLAQVSNVPYELILGGDIDRDKVIHILDEAHNAKPPETYYPHMDNSRDSFVLTTTHLGMLPEPFRNRCVHLIIEPYNNAELAEIARLYSKGLFDNGIINLIVDRTRGVPREIEVLCSRLLLYLASGELRLNVDNVRERLNSFGYYPGGFTRYDKQYLNLLKEVNSASLNTIISTLGIPKVTIVEYVEPFLLKGKLIQITSRGRKLTNLGERYLESL